MILIYFPEDLKLYCFRVFKESADCRSTVERLGVYRPEEHIGIIS